MALEDHFTPEFQHDLVAFAQGLVRIPSLSGQEGALARRIAGHMHALEFDEVIIDGMGNVLGRIGAGKPAILFDSHMDTVAVNEAEQWDVSPFSGEIVSGDLYGRGSVDMKASLAASLYAAVLANKMGFLTGKAVYISCSVYEEDCDGESLRYLFKEHHLHPDYVIICEPSNNQIALGHKGKAQISIKTFGTSAHGSAPEKGVNAIYAMAEIIHGVEQLNHALLQKEPPRGTLVLSKISSTSASLNAVPSECEIYLDRRLVPGETKETIVRELDQLIQNKNAAWQMGTLHRTSYTGVPITYEPFHQAWRIDLEHPLTRACLAAYQATFGVSPANCIFWDFSTNAVTPVSLGIPTIGFGPGDYKLAHMRNERCPVDQILAACQFYARVIQQL